MPTCCVALFRRNTSLPGVELTHDSRCASVSVLSSAWLSLMSGMCCSDTCSWAGQHAFGMGVVVQLSLHRGATGQPHSAGIAAQPCTCLAIVRGSSPWQLESTWRGPYQCPCVRLPAVWAPAVWVQCHCVPMHFSVHRHFHGSLAALYALLPPLQHADHMIPPCKCTIALPPQAAHLILPHLHDEDALLLRLNAARVEAHRRDVWEARIQHKVVWRHLRQHPNSLPSAVHFANHGHDTPFTNLRSMSCNTWKLARCKGSVRRDAHIERVVRRALDVDAELDVGEVIIGVRFERRLHFLHPVGHDGYEAQPVREELVVQHRAVLVDLHQVDGDGGDVWQDDTPQRVGNADVSVAEHELAVVVRQRPQLHVRLPPQRCRHGLAAQGLAAGRELPPPLTAAGGAAADQSLGVSLPMMLCVIPVCHDVVKCFVSGAESWSCSLHVSHRHWWLRQGTVWVCAPFSRWLHTRYNGNWSKMTTKNASRKYTACIQSKVINGGWWSSRVHAACWADNSSAATCAGFACVQRRHADLAHWMCEHSKMADDAAPSGAVHMVDRGDSVDIMLGLPSDTADHDLSISGGADALRVVLHGQSQPLLEVLQLYSTIDPEQTRHRVEDSRLTVTLHKRDPSLAWPSLHAVREEQQDQQVSAHRLPGCLAQACRPHCDHGRRRRRRRYSKSPEHCQTRFSLLTSAILMGWRAAPYAHRQLLRRRVLARLWRSAAGCGTCSRPRRTAIWPASGCAAAGLHNTCTAFRLWTG